MKTLLIFVLTCLWASAQLPIRAYLNSCYLIPGETTFLVLETPSAIDADFTIPSTEKYDLEYVNYRRYQNDSGQYGYRYYFELSSLHKGKHVIPSFEVVVRGQKARTIPVHFDVLPSTKLTFDTVKIGDHEVSYAIAVFLPERDLYVGETVPTEVKLYLPVAPSKFSVIEAGLPEIKREGISAWRYQSSKDSMLRPSPFLLSKGRFFTIIYRSSAHAIKDGVVSLGDGRARPVFKVVKSVRGHTGWVNEPIYLPFSKIERQALPLPKGAPASFNGAVGKFDLSVNLLGEAQSKSSAPISTRINIFGTGNLDKVRAPVLTAQENWKVYKPTKTQRGSERRFLTGSVEFTQLLRAHSPQSEIPPFEFSYFDPSKSEYVTLFSSPIPLAFSGKVQPPEQETPDPITPNTPSQPSAPITLDSIESAIPEETMSAVLDLKLEPNLLLAKEPNKIGRYWHVIPAVLTLILILALAWESITSFFFASPERAKVNAQIKALSKEKDSISFLKQAATLTKLFPESLPLAQEVTEKRDELCFTPDKSGVNLNDSDRQRILKQLTRAAKSLILTMLCVVTLSDQSQAQETPLVQKTPLEYHESALRYAEEGDYASARSAYLNAYPTQDYPADILYNLGTLYAKSEEPGLAMLYYRRALLLDPNHAEAKQNLRFLSRVNGSIVIRRKGVQNFIAQFPHSIVQNILFLFVWLFVICTLLRHLINSQRARNTLAIFTICIIFCIPFAAVAYFLYPKDGDFCSLDKTVVVTAPKSVTAKTGASEEADQVILAPPGSVSKLISQRGLWVYLEFANQTRAWLNTKHVSMLSPDQDFAIIDTLETKPDL